MFAELCTKSGCPKIKCVPLRCGGRQKDDVAVCLLYLIAPRGVWVAADVGVVVVSVAGDLAAEEGGGEVFFVDVVELNLGKHQALVVAMELVDFNGMFPALYEVARLLYALTAEGEELAGIVESDLLLPFEAADTVGRGSFDGEEAFVATGAHAYRAAMTTADVALQDVGLVVCQSAITVVGDEELTFDFFHDSAVLVAKVVKKKNL